VSSEENTNEKKDDKLDKMIAAAKEKHTGPLFLADYKFTDQDGKDHHLQFVYREPKEEEMDAYISQLDKSQTGANRMIMQMSIVAPDPQSIMNEIGNHQNAVATFIQSYLNPLSGAVKEVLPLRKI